MKTGRDMTEKEKQIWVKTMQDRLLLIRNYRKEEGGEEDFQRTLKDVKEYAIERGMETTFHMLEELLMKEKT